MKIFVVSLKNSVQRREKIAFLMQNACLPFEFFDAIKGNLEHPLIKEKYNDKKRTKIKGYSMRLGELGCFASHYSLWQKCAKLNEPILIFEDDIVPEHDLLQVVTQLKNSINTLEMERLSKTLSVAHLELQNVTDDYKLVKYLKYSRGSVGYFISPVAAKKLLSHAKDWFEPVDDYIDKEWLNNVTVYGVEPPCLAHDPNVPSEIGNRKKIKISTRQRIRREYYRSYD